MSTQETKTKSNETAASQEDVKTEKTSVETTKEETAKASETSVSSASGLINANELTLGDSFVNGDASSEESFKKLRTNLIYTDDLHVMAMTSSVPDEGKTVTTFHLAKAFAELGKKVVLIDCDLRRSSLKNMLLVNDDQPGFSEALTGQSDNFVCKTNINNLYISLTGKRPPNPSELLISGHFKKVLASLKEEFDYVIFDTPPVSTGSDASIIGRNVDGVILVVRNEFTKKNAVRRSVKELEANGARVIGTVLTRVKKDSSEYGHYGYYDYYY